MLYGERRVKGNICTRYNVSIIYCRGCKYSCSFQYPGEFCIFLMVNHDILPLNVDVFIPKQIKKFWSIKQFEKNDLNDLRFSALATHIWFELVTCKTEFVLRIGNSQPQPVTPNLTSIQVWQTRRDDFERGFQCYNMLFISPIQMWIYNVGTPHLNTLARPCSKDMLIAFLVFCISALIICFWLWLLLFKWWTIHWRMEWKTNPIF